MAKLELTKGTLLAFFAGLILPVSALANGLGESTPYRFEQKDRLGMLELQLLKESGFYDSQAGGGGTSTSGDTIINGDQINCIVQSSAMANSNSTGMDALTGSLLGVTDSSQGADANANDSDAYGSGDGGLDIGLENDGDQDAAISNSTISSDVGQFSGGGTSDQTVDNYQSADNTSLTSTIDDVTVCDGMTIN